MSRSAHGVVEPGAVALLDVLHEVVAVDEDVAGEDIAHIGRREVSRWGKHASRHGDLG